MLPLVTSIGAGAEMRRAMGVAVFSGMLGVTAFGIFLTPVFYVLLRRVTGNRPLVLHGDALPFAASHGEQPRGARRCRLVGEARIGLTRLRGSYIDRGET